MEESDFRRISGKFRRTKMEWDNKMTLPFGDCDLYNLEYESENKRYLLGHTSYMCDEHHDERGKKLKFRKEAVKEQPSDEQIKENLTFSYPLMREQSSSGILQRHKRVTIMLHGLNERFYDKYLRWAYPIWQGTEAPVVIFPLTFSINRVWHGWGKQIPETRERRARIRNNRTVYYDNATMSERLGKHPKRFFWGGVQSYWDIIDLVRQIRNPKGDKEINKHFAPDTRVDFFGYSSGGYIALALLLANHEGLFSDSRACLFASCVEMNDIRPISPFIIDRKGEDAVREMFVDGFDNLPNERMKHWFEHHEEARWLGSFAGAPPQDRTQRDIGLKKLAPRLLGIANSNDKVTPLAAMLNVLQGVRRNTGVRVEELKLGKHENPFAYTYYPDPKQSDARKYRKEKLDFVTNFLNKELYGSEFKQFIDLIVEHLK